MEDDEIVIGINKPHKEIDKKKSKNNKSKKKTNSKKDINEKKVNSKTRISSSISKNTKKVTNNTDPKKERIKVISIFVLVFIVIIIFLSSSLFNISEIFVTQNQILSEEKIVSMSGLENYTNIFRFNKKKIVDSLKENPYIENAYIHRRLPNKVEIEVKERIPSFMLQFADSYVYINNQGYMLEVSTEKINVPIIVGFTTDLNSMKAGNRINNSDLEKMNLIIKIYEIAKSNDLAEAITKIDISNPKNYTIILENEGKTVYLGDCSDADLNTKMLYLKSIVDESTGRSGEVFLNVDLNVEHVYVRWSTE